MQVSNPEVKELMNRARELDFGPPQMAHRTLADNNSPSDADAFQLRSIAL